MLPSTGQTNPLTKYVGMAPAEPLVQGPPLVLNTGEERSFLLDQWRSTRPFFGLNSYTVSHTYIYNHIYIFICKHTHVYMFLEFIHLYTIYYLYAFIFTYIYICTQIIRMLFLASIQVFADTSITSLNQVVLGEHRSWQPLPVFIDPIHSRPRIMASAQSSVEINTEINTTGSSEERDRQVNAAMSPGTSKMWKNEEIRWWHSLRVNMFSMWENSNG